MGFLLKLFGIQLARSAWPRVCEALCSGCARVREAYVLEVVECLSQDSVAEFPDCASAWKAFLESSEVQTLIGAFQASLILDRVTTESRVAAADLSSFTPQVIVAATDGQLPAALRLVHEFNQGAVTTRIKMFRAKLFLSLNPPPNSYDAEQAIVCDWLGVLALETFEVSAVTFGEKAAIDDIRGHLASARRDLKVKYRRQG